MQGTTAPVDSSGTFTINGNYSQDAGGTLDILLGGTGAGQFSLLAVSGLASLDGSVDFTTINGFTPAPAMISHSCSLARTQATSAT